MKTFLILYSFNGINISLEMDNLTEALEIVGINRIITITKVEVSLSN